MLKVVKTVGVGTSRDVAPTVLSPFLQQPTATTWLPGLALLYVEIGQLDDSRLLFEQLAADGFAGIARDGRWYFCLAYLSEVCAALGDVARAGPLYRMFQPYTGHNLILGGGTVCCGSADLYLGLLAATVSCWTEATRPFEQALAMNQKIGAHAPLAHTRYNYAAMLLARDQPADNERAAALSQLSLESARDLGMRALEERAAGRLAQMARRQPVLDAVDDLTAREIEVLRLMSISRSNAEIALVLGISLNTVATHVRNILAKTGRANRAGAAAYAIRHHLAGESNHP